MIDVLPACIDGRIRLFARKAFALQLMGIAIGFMAGILPGLGGTIALTLMLPFTFSTEEGFERSVRLPATH